MGKIKSWLYQHRTVETNKGWAESQELRKGDKLKVECVDNKLLEVMVDDIVCNDFFGSVVYLKTRIIKEDKVDE